MTTYAGMTYDNIREMAITVAKKAGLMLENSEAIAFFDEAMMIVAEDIWEEGLIEATAWATVTASHLSLSTKGYMAPTNVFGDSTKLQYIEYDKYLELFGGDQSQKPSFDTNVYYTILGDKLFVEPDITDFTNVNVQYAPRITSYATKSGVSNIPELPAEYRILVSYKICDLAFPGVFTRKYEQMKDDKKYIKEKKTTSGQAEFWDPYEGSDDYRRSGWPGNNWKENE